MGQNFVQDHTLLSFDTTPKSFLLITDNVTHWLESIGAQLGTVTVFVQHTSCSLTIQEDADPTARQDLRDALAELAPQDRPYRHHMEGPDDMPGHIKSMLTDTSLTIPVIDGKLDKGMWQGIYLLEHRDKPHTRKVRLLFQGSIIDAM